MTASEVLDDAGFDFSDLTDDTAEPVAEIRGTRNTNPGAPQRRRRAAKTKLNELHKQLSQQMFMAGTMVGMALPVTGYYACQEADSFTRAVVDLAATRPEWVEALQYLANIQPGLLIARTAVGLGAALAVDRKRADPDKKLMQLLGVTAAYYAVQPKPDQGIEEGSAYTPPPGAFHPI